MTVDVHQLASILSSTASQRGEYTDTVGQVLDELVTVLDNEDGQMDGEIGETSAFQLEGRIEAFVRQSLHDCCSSALQQALSLELRQLVPTRFPIRSPFSSDLVPTPSALLSTTFEFFDDNSVDPKSKGNGRYDLLDMPLASVRNVLKSMADSGLIFSETDQYFLKRHFGIDVRNAFSFDAAITSQWLTPRIWFGKEMPAVAKHENLPAIPVEFKGVRPRGPLADKTVALFQSTFRRVAEVSGVPPSRWPAKIVFVNEADTRIDFMSVGFSFTPGTASEDSTKFSALCKKVARLNAAAMDGTLTPEEVHEGHKQTLPETNAKFLQLVRKPYRGSDWGLFVTETFFSMAVEAVEISEIGDPADGKVLLENIMAPIAYAFAHELVHLEEMSQGLPVEEHISDAVTRGFVGDSPYWIVLLSKCMVYPGQPASLFQFANRGLLPIVLAPEAIGAITALYHQREENANLIGLYIAARAGYPSKIFGGMYLPNRPATLSHPAEGDMKKNLDDMAAALRDAKMVPE